MNKVLWMNSGGKDAAFVYKNLDKSCCDVTPYLLTTNDDPSMMNARALCQRECMEMVEIPYAPTRTAIASFTRGATVFWVMELKLRAMHYAWQNGYDTVLNGSTNAFASNGADSNEYEEFFQELQEFLEVPEDKRVTLLRPIKTDIQYDLLK